MKKIQTGGFDKLLREAVDELSTQMEDLKGFARVDSEIERLFLVSLLLRVETLNLGDLYESAGVAKDARHLAALLDMSAKSWRIVIAPQYQMPDWRVDFLIFAWGFGSNGQEPGWRKLIVECDGHAFHERTKEQAKRDRSRDREAQLKGITVFRFTGSEIWNDAWGCSAKVIDWAMAGAV